MSVMTILFVAMVLDYLFGDPDRIWQKYPHPAVLMGDVVDWFDTRLNRTSGQFALGIVTITVLVILALGVGWVLSLIPDYGLIDVICLAILLAHKSLVEHVRAVATGLGISVVEGRLAVSRIVGRDTDGMDASAVSAAAIESAAENYSDGIIAPLFWYILLGLPGLFMYKIVNTADSMIGHVSPRYEKFGYGAAKLDDVLNFIPARLCGALICLVARSRDAFDLMLSDAPLHRSPNAGWPEAAMAGVLGIRLSGPRRYEQGALSDDSYLNPMGRSTLSETDIEDALAVLNRVWLLLAGVFGFFVILQILI